MLTPCVGLFLPRQVRWQLISTLVCRPGCRIKYIIYNNKRRVSRRDRVSNRIKEVSWKEKCVDDRDWEQRLAVAMPIGDAFYIICIASLCDCIPERCITVHTVLLHSSKLLSARHGDTKQRKVCTELLCKFSFEHFESFPRSKILLLCLQGYLKQLHELSPSAFPSFSSPRRNSLGK